MCIRDRPDSENKFEEAEYSASLIKGGAALDPLIKEEFISSGIPSTFMAGFIELPYQSLLFKYMFPSK